MREYFIINFDFPIFYLDVVICIVLFSLTYGFISDLYYKTYNFVTLLWLLEKKLVMSSVGYKSLYTLPLHPVNYVE